MLSETMKEQLTTKAAAACLLEAQTELYIKYRQTIATLEVMGRTREKSIELVDQALRDNEKTLKEQFDRLRLDEKCRERAATAKVETDKLFGIF